MKKIIKLLILIILSLSVYFIYEKTKNTTTTILCIGDNLSLGINSYGIKEYGYIDYYKDYLTSKNKKVYLINKYSQKDLSIKELLIMTKNNPSLKKDLRESNQLILTIGYNDLIYKMSIENSINNNKLKIIINDIENEYNQLINEIRKYYKNKIIVIGYYKSYKDDYYINLGIKQLNNKLAINPNIIYIDTYNLLSNRKKYFSNPSNYYPNRYGYQLISKQLQKLNL